MCSVDSASTMAMATSPAAVTRPATTMSKVALLELVDVGEADPAVTDECDAYAANRTAERQARPAGWTVRPH